VRAMLTLHLRPDADPALSTDDVDALVAGAKRADVNGKAPTDEAWVPTFNGPAAVAEGWQAKAAIAARRVDISRSGESVKRSSVLDACLRMARLWAGRGGLGSAAGLSPSLAARQELVGVLPIGNLPEPEVGGYGAGGAAGGRGEPAPWGGSDSWA
jgi:hypothetical protein